MVLGSVIILEGQCSLPSAKSTLEVLMILRFVVHGWLISPQSIFSHLLSSSIFKPISV